METHHRANGPRGQKTLGILGGMGPAATAYFYRKVIEATPAGCDQEHLHVIIDSNAKVPDRTEAVQSGNLAPLLDALRSSARRLVDAGAQIIAMPCNTAHVDTSAILARAAVASCLGVRERSMARSQARQQAGNRRFEPVDA